RGSTGVRRALPPRDPERGMDRRDTAAWTGLKRAWPVVLGVAAVALALSAVARVQSRTEKPKAGESNGGSQAFLGTISDSLSALAATGVLVFIAGGAVLISRLSVYRLSGL